MEIVEPNVTVAKSITAAPADPNGGDTVSYQLIIENDSDIDAFDLTFSDVLPAQMDLQTGTFTATRQSDSGNVSALFTVTANGIDEVAPFISLLATGLPSLTTR